MLIFTKNVSKKIQTFLGPRNDEYIDSLKSSENYIEVAEDEEPVYISCYTDDFIIADGSSKTKVTACYSCISNLKYSQQSKRDDIFFVVLCIRSQFDIMKKEKYFEPFINQRSSCNNTRTSW